MTAYVQCASLLAALITVLSAAVFGIMASFRIGRKLLETVIEMLTRIGKFKTIANFFSFFFLLVPQIILVRCIRPRRTY